MIANILRYFVVVLVANVAVVSYILPEVFPQIHAGDGQLVNMDSKGFHLMAIELANKITSSGSWELWEFRPQAQLPVGIYSAIYALFSTNNPLAVSVFNGALFAFALAYMVDVNKKIFRLSDRYVFMIGLPAIVFPSMVWVYTQINKDLFAVSGIFLTVSSLVSMLFEKKSYFKSGFVMLGGLMMIGLARVYLLEIFIFASFIIIGLTIVLDRDFSLKPKLMAVLSFGAVGLVAFWSGLTDEKVLQIADIRSEYELFFPDASSKIDDAVTFQSVSDFIMYAPRSLLIWFFFPIPFLSEFAGDLKKDFQTLIALFEMSFVYLLYGSFMFKVVKSYRQPHHRFKEKMTAVFTATIFFMIVGHFYVSAIPNLGTLYRMRLGVLLCLLTFLLGFILSKSDVDGKT